MKHIWNLLHKRHIRVWTFIILTGVYLYNGSVTNATPQSVISQPELKVEPIAVVEPSAAPSVAPSKPVETPRAVIARETHDGDCESFRPLVEKHWPANAVETAMKVMKAESGCNTQSHNYSTKTKDDSYGLYQINLYGANKNTRPAPSVLKTAEGNIQFAAKLFTSGGWGHWTVCKKYVKCW